MNTEKMHTLVALQQHVELGRLLTHYINRADEQMDELHLRIGDANETCNNLRQKIEELNALLDKTVRQQPGPRLDGLLLEDILHSANAGGLSDHQIIKFTAQAAHNKIHAIKLIRQLYNLGLKDAKDLIDAAGSNRELDEVVTRVLPILDKETGMKG